MAIENPAPLALGNQAFRNKDYATAIEQYLIALQQMPALSDTINTNITLARTRLQREQPNAPQSLATPATPTPKIAVVVHVYYLEIWPEIAQLLKAITYPFDLFVTTTTEQAGTVIPVITTDFPNARISIQPNSGMDVLPFLALIPLLISAGYVAVCKLHTKRGDGGEEGTQWRRALLNPLIGDNAVFSEVVQAFVQHADLQLVGPSSLYLSARKLMYDNEPNIKYVLEQIEGRALPVEDWGFFAGSMFWVRPTALQKLAQGVAYLQTQPVEYQADGQISHAVERLLGLVPVLHQGQVGLLHSAGAASARRYVLQVVAAHTQISQAEIPDLMRQYANLEADLMRLRESGQLDTEHYLAQHPGLVGLDVDLLAHYLLVDRFDTEHKVLCLTDKNVDFRQNQEALEDVYTLTANIKNANKFINACESDLIILTNGIREALYNDYETVCNRVYCLRYPDVGEAVALNHFTSGKQHFDMFGKAQGRIFDFDQIIKILIDNFKHTKSELEKSEKSLIQVAPECKAEDNVDFRSRIIPYYLSDAESISNVIINKKIAIHLHLYYVDMLDEFMEYLKNIPTTFDLYVSIPEDQEKTPIFHKLNLMLSNVGIVVVKGVPNRGRDIAPFIIQFGTYLTRYDAICHIHTKKSPHNEKLNKWVKDILNLLLGSKTKVSQILSLLSTTAKFVFPEGQQQYIKDPTGWADNYDIAKAFLSKYTNISINNFQIVEFPEGSMFWARASCLKTFLSLPLRWEDFPQEPIPPDGTLAHALERLFFVFAHKHPGQYVRLQQYDSIQDFRFYEEQRDYSSSLTHQDIKILAFYLPQFHPIPENDKWHGKGFTEWTKVKSANPLFVGHYQQHIPHPDIGYYLLDSPNVLKKQAEMMQKAGVYGQIFYHYWFSGKLILEEPAQMLLHNSDIQMPFCFCWANENWTKRWDGNENEVLLAQNYSIDDASNFIKYLIPFFKDKRYIKVDNRPVFFVYRATSIPNPIEYQNIWKVECEANGINAPYVVAVLTRGAKHPNDFGMDAGVERVLHDWTNGNVAEIQNRLNPYWPLNGSILPYNEVANYYMEQTDQKDFTYFRSLIPIWDNTARYHSEAYLVHQSNPELFQNWLEHTIQYTRKTLPDNKRFIVINAWNEWAEGAHLEPDTRFGYSYLNSVGRALSNISFSASQRPIVDIPSDTSLYIDIPEYIIQQLNQDEYLKKRFVWHLAKSTIFGKCQVCISENSVLDEYKDSLNLVAMDKKHAQFTLQFRRIALITPECIENMLQTAMYYTTAIVLSNSYDSSIELIKVENNSSVDPTFAYRNTLLLFPNYISANTFFKIRTDARAFVSDYTTLDFSNLPRVTTIIRFHKSANFNELRNALYCLAAMHSCVVTPFIAAQDLSNEQQATLEELLKEFSYVPDQFPRVKYFYSKDGCGDLRSKMLNECIKNVKTRYASLLDYDDLLMSHAFDYLIKRLKNTGKAIAFGRVFATDYNSEMELFIDRKRTYEYGYSYDEFIKLNHAPIHSFMLDLARLDLSSVKYFEDQRFMEDYYFTLQVFTRDNADWIGLANNVYIGDYIHCVNRQHTLAFSDEEQHSKILKDEHFLFCEAKICELGEQLANKLT